MLRFINTRQALNSAGRLLEQKLKAQLKIDGTVATKKLYNSITYSLSFGEDEHKLYIWADRKIAYVDRGRKAGRVPATSTILRWAEAKGIKPKSSDGRFKPSTKKNKYQMAYNIAKAIGEKGTIKRFGYGGSDVLNFVLKNNDKRIKESISSAFEKDLHAFVQQDLANKK